jgi:Protein of unknown function (DUF3024)
MALPELVRRSCDRALQALYDRRVPTKVRDQVHLEWIFRGNAVTLFERRRPWRGRQGDEWTRSRVARVELDSATRTWRLSWSNSTGRWLPYEGFLETESFAAAVAEIEADPRGAFWG